MSTQAQQGGRGWYDGHSSRALLREIRESQQVRRDVEVREFRVILAWADENIVHDPDYPELDHPDLTTPDDWGHFLDTGVALVGESMPSVSEFALADLVAVLGRTPAGGRDYVANCLELGWRLPHLAARVLDGRARLHKALEVADLTRGLSDPAAGFVDAHLHFALDACSYGQVRRLVEEAIVRFDPEVAEERRARAGEHRRFDVDVSLVDDNGLVPVDGVLDAADAHDLDQAVARRAKVLGQLGCGESMDVRRSRAVGELAREDLTLDLETLDTTTGEVKTVSAGRKVVLHVHLTDTTITGSPDPADAASDVASGAADGGNGAVGRWEEGGQAPISVEQIREWCGTTAATILVRPVIDLADHVPVDSYEIPDRLKVRINLRDHHCVFPRCGKPAARCDHDHITPHNKGGQTCPCQLAPLCRAHHRLKTHTSRLYGWTYAVIDPGSYLWRSPTGNAWLVDHRGTRDLDPGRAIDEFDRVDPDPPPDTAPD